MVGEGEEAEFVRKGIPAGTEKTTSPKEKMLEESFRENKTSVSYFNTKMGMERKPMNKPFRSRTAGEKPFRCHVGRSACSDRCFHGILSAPGAMFCLQG